MYPDNVFILDSKARWRITILVKQVPISLVDPKKYKEKIMIILTVNHWYK